MRIPQAGTQSFHPEVEAERAGVSVLEREGGLRGREGRKQWEGIPTSYPNCIADDASSLSTGNDILVIQRVIFFLPVSDDDEDFGGIFSGPI